MEAKGAKALLKGLSPLKTGKLYFYYIAQWRIQGGAMGAIAPSSLLVFNTR